MKGVLACVLDSVSEHAQSYPPTGRHAELGGRRVRAEWVLQVVLCTLEAYSTVVNLISEIPYDREYDCECAHFALLVDIVVNFG